MKKWQNFDYNPHQEINEKLQIIILEIENINTHSEHEYERSKQNKGTDNLNYRSE